MKTTSFFLFAILLFIAHMPHSQLFALEKKKIKAGSQFPIELNLIFQSMQTQLETQTEAEYLSMLKHVYTIDSYASNLTKEELFFTIKSEIYKAILKFAPPTQKTFTPDMIIDIKKASLISRDPFIKWMLLALNVDAEQVTIGKNYKDYLLQKNERRPFTPETKKVAKKILMINKIYSLFNPDSPDNFKMEYMPQIISECLKNIEEALFILAMESRQTPLKPIGVEGDKLSFFELQNEKLDTKIKTTKSKSVEDILDDKTLIETREDLPLPKPSSEDWLKEERIPLDIKNLPSPSSETDWLENQE